MAWKQIGTKLYITAKSRHVNKKSYSLGICCITKLLNIYVLRTTITVWYVLCRFNMIGMDVCFVKIGLTFYVTLAT